MVKSFKERILRTFTGERIERVVWQPRIMYWFNGNHVYVPKEKHNYVLHDPTIPGAYFGMDALEVHQALDSSIRYPAETLGIGLCSTLMKNGTKVRSRVTTTVEAGTATTYSTPVGEVTQKTKGGYTYEKMVKHTEDLEVVKYIIDDQYFHFNEDGFHFAEEIFHESGDMGVPQAYYSRSPLMKCILNYIGFENTVLMLARHKKEMIEFMNFLGEWDDKMYEILVESPMKILNFGENIDGNLVSPRYFKKYCMPYYKRRVKQVHDAGKFCHIHMDGALRDLLPLVGDTDFDGIEACTPLPQGDVTEDEIKAGLGDKILLDGIPATLFLPQFPVERLKECVTRLLDLFAPNIILGVSDELPPNANINRLPLVTKLVNNYNIQD
ncbi:MAG: uroporphyrinogen decarboxylase family protein [Promethearchaeota archaeon]